MAPAAKQTQQKGPLRRMQVRLRRMHLQLRRLDKQIQRLKEISRQMERR
jgi:hypothetical protein